MTDLHSEYVSVFERVRSLCSEVEEGPIVPACPDWTVRELVAHLAGVASDVVSGSYDGYASQQWTTAHVTQRSDRSMGELFAEWHASVARLESAFDDLGRLVQMMVFVDVAAHEQDIRDALDLPGQRDADTVHLAVDVLIGGLRRGFEAAGIATLEIVTDRRSFMVGRETPAGRLNIDDYQLFRSLTGRRPRYEVESYGWSGDKDVFIDHWLQEPFVWK